MIDGKWSSCIPVKDVILTNQTSNSVTFKIELDKKYENELRKALGLAPKYIFLDLWDKHDKYNIAKMLDIEPPYLKCVFDSDLLIIDGTEYKTNEWNVCSKLGIPFDTRYGGYSGFGDSIIVNVSVVRKDLIGE